jgi:hypothetical protein
VHLGPYFISVIENNPNKNLIISMSFKQEFRQSKRRKGKIDPQIHVNSNEGSLKEFKQCFKVFLCFLSIGIPYYKERCVDEEKIINSSDSKSFPKLSQTETPSRILFGPTRDSLHPPQKVPAGHCSAPLDIARNSNLGPMAKFLRELYIYPYTSNDSPLFAFGFYC